MIFRRSFLTLIFATLAAASLVGAAPAAAQSSGSAGFVREMADRAFAILQAPDKGTWNGAPGRSVDVCRRMEGVW